MAVELVDVQGGSHSANMLSRTFGAAGKSTKLPVQREIKQLLTDINKEDIGVRDDTL